MTGPTVDPHAYDTRTWIRCTICSRRLILTVRGKIAAQHCPRCDR